MEKRKVVYALALFLGTVGLASLQAEVPVPHCRDFDIEGECSMGPSGADHCDDWNGAQSCHSLTGAPGSCVAMATGCDATDCGPAQAVTCKFSGTYTPPPNPPQPHY